jgi:hypothetical protein
MVIIATSSTRRYITSTTKSGARTKEVLGKANNDNLALCGKVVICIICVADEDAGWRRHVSLSLRRPAVHYVRQKKCRLFSGVRSVHPSIYAFRPDITLLDMIQICRAEDGEVFQVSIASCVKVESHDLLRRRLTQQYGTLRGMETYTLHEYIEFYHV